MNCPRCQYGPVSVEYDIDDDREIFYCPYCDHAWWKSMVAYEHVLIDEWLEDWA